MISKTEIKKCGWKPIPGTAIPEIGLGPHYELNIHGKSYDLELHDTDTGEVFITELEEDKKAPKKTLFEGYIPARYELQIIMRCLKIG